MERKVYWNGKPFNAKECAEAGHYDILNAYDKVCDMFYELTKEERKQGMTYGEFFVIEE